MTSKAVRTTGRYKHDHGAYPRRSPEYVAWIDIIQRCANPNNVAYHYYGGRGISVCEAWKTSFVSFLEHVGARPSSAHSIDRINNGGNYEPGNVRWATRLEQEHNKRKRRSETFQKKTHCKNGHKYTPENTGGPPHHRRCLICNRAYQRAVYEQQKARQ